MKWMTPLRTEMSRLMMVAFWTCTLGLLATASHAQPPLVFNVTDYGAVPDADAARHG